MEEEKIEKKKKNLGLIILIISMILIIIGLITYILYDKGIIFSNGNNTEEKIDVDNNEKLDNSKETEITDKKVQLELSKKIDQISYLKNTDGSDLFSGTSYGFNMNLFKQSVLTENEKLTVALKTLQDKYTPITIESSKMVLPSEWEYLRNTITKDDYQILLSDVKERYSSLFGTEEVEYTSVSGCPSFVYDNTNQVYYVIARCGGTSGRSVISYKESYMKKGNEAYVYVYYGSSSLSDDGTKVNIYNSLIESTGEVTQQPYKTNADINEQVITSDNYQDFEKYKFTFKQNDNKEYIFVKVEKQ